MPTPSPSRGREHRALLALELLLVVGLWVADMRGLVPLSSTPFMLVLAWASLRLRGLPWSGLGLSWPRSWKRAVAIGIAAGIAMELFATLVTTPFLTSLTGRPPDLSDFEDVVGNLPRLLVMLGLSWLLAAFGEELAYRGYLLNRVVGDAPASGATWVMAVVLVSVMFGLQHESQGVTGMLQEGLSGFLLGLIYLATGRNLLAPVVAHGVSNTVAFALIYVGRYPGV